MQPLPALPVDDVLVVETSNRANQRGPHGLFRYFGKLAPDVTGAVLDIAAGYLTAAPALPVVDVMCGSGTTMIEAADRNWSSVGIDVNPVALLYSRVKTTPANEKKVRQLLRETLDRAGDIPIEDAEAVFAATRNASRWFSAEARHSVGALRLAIGELSPSPERDVLLASLLARLRRISNASARTGRIFFDPESAVPDIAGTFTECVEQVLAAIPGEPQPVEVRMASAMDTGLPANFTNLVFCHPPYFALYRYSADVLRFELEIGGWSRPDIVRNEIREGWKSGDASKLDDHVADMGKVFQEARRITRADGVFAFVTSNSTLGDEQLPVVDRLAAVANDHGWEVATHRERTAHYGSASYHRSARSDKVIQRDHVLIFRTD